MHQQVGQRKRDRDMAVVATGVHLAGGARDILHLIGLGDGERIHIGTHQQRTLRAFPARGPCEQPHDTSAADLLGHREPRLA